MLEFQLSSSWLKERRPRRRETEGSRVAAKMGGVASLALDVVAFALLGLALLRVLAGITITDLHNWYIAQVKRAREEAALSVGLISVPISFVIV